LGELTVASLFSGCGGFDLGFHAEGFRSTAAFDIEPAAVESFNRNVAPVAEVADLGESTPRITADVLLAGSPCQGFSTSGKRKLDDPRNDLLIRAGEIALANRPRVFVLENVPAAISGPHGTRWEQVESMLKNAGYGVARLLAEGVCSGVPQLRKRLFLLAWRGGAEISCSPAERKAPTLAAALANLDGVQGHDPSLMSDGCRERMIAERIGQGQKLCNVRVSQAAIPTWRIPEAFGVTTDGETEILDAIVRLRRRDRRRDFGDADPVSPPAIDRMLGRCCSFDVERLVAAGYLRRIDDFVDLRHTYNGKFRRLSLSGISPTVDTHFGDPTLFLHPTEHRGLTPREAARIQGFGDEFELPASRPRAFRMIGNAVPPPMGARLAAFVRQALLPVAA
jgi:DNA (cytosine-5)-methyltransferase 1